MATESKVTTDHKQIQKWAEERGGKPAQIKGTGGKEDAGLLRIDFPGGKGDSLEEISWEDFFEKFDEKQLAFLYQEKTAGGKISRFSKIVNRETAEQKGSSKPSRPSAKKDTKSKEATKPKASAKEKKATDKPKAETKPRAATTKAKAKPKAKA